MSGEAIFGIDVDSVRLMVACHGSESVESIGNQTGAIRAWLARIPAHSRIGVESTSGYHQRVVTLAQSAGHRVYVLNPRDVRFYAKGVGRRGKTDRVDAQVIARYVAKEAEHLHVYVPRSDEQQALHVLQQQRSALRRTVTQLRKALTAHGPLRDSFRPLMQAAREAQRDLDRQIRSRTDQGPHAALFRRLMTVPGIGPVIAACLVQHLTRWPLAHVDAWVACTGLDPRPNDSGRKIGRRVLSKRGDATLRQMLYLAAMSFARNPVGKAIAARYRQRLSSTATFNLLARMLARIVWSLSKSGNTFCLERFATDHKITLAA
jgi:transposase